MKAYKFRFENVLKSKQIVVDDLASKTARAQRILFLEEKKREDMRERETLCMRELVLQQTAKRINTGEVQRCHHYLQQLRKTIAGQENLVSEIASRVEKLRLMLAEAEKERKILQKLDEREREEFFRGLARKEQALLDEIGVNKFVQRSTHGRSHAPPPR